MRIISKYKDYYDPIMRTGFDPSIVYMRSGYMDNPIVINGYGSDCPVSRAVLNSINTDLIGDPYYWLGRTSKKVPSIARTRKDIRQTFKKIYPKYILEYIDTYIIGFCGKFYITHKISFITKYARYPTYTQILASRNGQVTQFIKNQDTLVIGETPDIVAGEPNTIFELLECPAFVIDLARQYSDGWGLLRNPVLKNYGLEKIIDPYTAFQELTMYIGNILVDDNTDMESISDESLMKSKGFDEWSFKKVGKNSRYHTEKKNK